MDPRPADPTSEPAALPLTNTAVSPAGDETNPRAPAEPTGPSYSFLAPPEQPDEIGRLGTYRVLGQLGRGGMGVVFRADDTQLKRQVALKVMLPEVAADARARARFLREAESQAQVQHENVAVIHQVGEVNGVPFIAMPLLKGQTLGAALKQSTRPPTAELIRIGKEMAEGLAAAHAAGLVHRDIKPANVWLDGPKRRVRILDFGLARTGATKAADDEQLTARGAILGTPAFMSPEQAKGEPVDHRSDLFSLGVVLYQMATGTLPFTGPNTFGVLLAVTEHHPPAAHELAPDLPPALSELIWRLMAKAPAARPQTAEDVAAELEALEGGPGAPRVQVIPLASVVEVPTGPDPWADIDLTEPAAPDPDEDEVTLADRAEAPKARRAVLIWAALGGLLLVGGAALALVLLGPKPTGKLVVEAPDSGWEVVVKKDGQVIRDRTRDREFALPPGEYTVELVNAPPGLNVQPPRVALAKNGTERVRLWVEKKLPGVKVPEKVPGTDPPAPADPQLTAEQRRALEWVLSVGGKLNLLVDGRDVSVVPGGKLPAGPFVVRDVNLTDAVGLDEKSLESLRAVPPVQRGLTLTNTGITDDDLAKVLAFPGFIGMPAINLTGTNITDAGLAHVGKLTALTYLDLTRTRITGAGLAHLRELKLETLTLHLCPVNAAAMEHLADMTSLTRLWMMYTGVTDAGFAKLSKLTNLVYLHPGPITDASADTLLNFRGLATLHLMGSKFTGVGLKKLAALPALSIVGIGECALDDAGLAAVKEFPALTVLSLQGNKDRITDVGLEHLVECTGLRHANLRDTKVTEPGVKALAEKLPLCKIDWDGTVIEPKPLPDVLRASVAALLKEGAIVTASGEGRGRVLKAADELKGGERIKTIGIGSRENPLDDRGIRALRSFPAEGWEAPTALLALGGPCSAESFRAVTRLPGMRPVSVLEFHTFDVPEAALAHLTNLPELRGVVVTTVPKLTEIGFRHLAALPKLRQFALQGADFPIAALAALRTSSIAHLDLIGSTCVDDTAVGYLAAVSRLASVDLKKTKVTRAGAEKLAQALPQCKIVWDGGTIAPRRALGYGLEFDGKGHVTFPTLKYDGTHPLTIEVWIDPAWPAEERTQYLFSDVEQAGIGVFIGPGGTPNTWEYSAMVHTGGAYRHARAALPVVPRPLTHLAGVYDGKGQVQVFVDGKLGATVPAKGAYRAAPVAFMFGANPGPGNVPQSEFFTGTLAGIRVSKVVRYDKDFSPARRFEPDKDTIALYHCTDGAGDTLADSSGNGHHGKIVGARWAVGPDRAANRRAAEVLNPHADLHLKLASDLASDKEVHVKKGEKLPDEPFAVLGCSPRGALPADFVRAVLLPTVSDLPNLWGIADHSHSTTWTDDDLARLADAPVAARLNTLRGGIALTPKGVGALKRFPGLKNLSCWVGPDDVLIRLKELPKLNWLVLRGKDPRPIGPEAWATVAGLKLTALELYQIELDGSAAKALAAVPEPFHFLALIDCTRERELLPVLAKNRNLRILVWGSAVTDADLAALDGFDQLRELVFHDTAKLTRAGVEKLARALPLCKITWAGGVIEPTKEP